MINSTSFEVFLVGLVIFAAMALKPIFDRARVPDVVGYLALGFLLSLLNHQFSFISEGSHGIFEFLAQMGLVVLLFRVGLESKLRELMGQLQRASVVWVGDVVISGTLGFATSYWILGLGLVPSLIAGTALTATSVGISVGVWQAAGVIKSSEGQLLLDVAELDDISAVILMALLFSIVPHIKDGLSLDILPELGLTTLIFLIKFVLFGLACFLFSMYAEKPLTEFYRRLESSPDPMILMVSVAMLIAALAGLLGFSVAIGAFFGGLVFSRDPEMVKMEHSFLPIYELFSPFFFIGLGLNMDVSSIGSALGIGLVLVISAAISKVLAAGLPLLAMAGLPAAALVGVSMIPRAEIALAVIKKGVSLGDWAVPQKLYGAMVMVSALTCIIAPLAVRLLFKTWKPDVKEDAS